MQNISFPSWPSFSPEEVEAAATVLRSNKVNYWTGNEGRAFEQEFAAWTGAKHAIALANGTVALEIALKGLGIGAGDEVIVTPRSFIASASCVAMAGATPVFADIDRNTQALSAETILPVVSPRTKAIIIVHLGGMPADMDPVMTLARERGLFVIEDCAQAHGARYKGRSVGTIGDVGAWSFCQDKIMTTGGEGGMVTTNDAELWSRMWSLKDHGKGYATMHVSEPQATFRWVHEGFGTNGRMLEMQAAIGRLQIGKMDEWAVLRGRHADQIHEAARSVKGLRVPDIPNWAEPVAYRCYVFVNPAALAEGWTRDRIIHSIRADGVPCFVGSCSEIYLEKAFDGTPWRPEARLPVARELGETSLAFLVHPSLTSGHIDRTCDVLCDVMRRAAA
ncbi:glutamine--scyllo-inositol transaminase [Hyphomicrobium denitrificans 1NES1]|uniref:Glutamine--scyllo-inositol transaminase n=1 Tax=Hyphomicrobium denitrificans 1NES1 TaxID=670307 RepID=N0B090_9HYPH|nr:DegT/DnrJ/EryC1/StrS aminotransferase family protein [Hyphomicrobium denitrificans]AGK56318.1 glutamine--scyllo-inositol transaminase [Hyphomicrobium denitrificans 1NES1]